LIIAALNAFVLSILLILWTDRFELLMNVGVRIIECLKIIAFTIASLIIMRIAVFFFRKKGIRNSRTKIVIASLLTLLTSSFLYLDYASKILNNKIINRTFREQISTKIIPAKEIGIKATGLTILEYKELSKFTSFPEIHKQANDINCLYECDGFFDDYYFKLTYYLPKGIKMDTLNFEHGALTKYQRIEQLENQQKVTYSEIKR